MHVRRMHMLHYKCTVQINFKDKELQNDFLLFSLFQLQFPHVQINFKDKELQNDFLLFSLSAINFLKTSISSWKYVHLKLLNITMQ